MNSLQQQVHEETAGWQNLRAEFKQLVQSARELPNGGETLTREIYEKHLAADEYLRQVLGIVVSPDGLHITPAYRAPATPAELKHYAAGVHLGPSRRI